MEKEYKNLYEKIEEIKNCQNTGRWAMYDNGECLCTYMEDINCEYRTIKIINDKTEHYCRRHALEEIVPIDEITIDEIGDTENER